ncbi:MAG TPA: hypothetical protein VN715_11680 [Roseiarcus sp.]|nr:hypothetical protein [Roseiarcus sp.]
MLRFLARTLGLLALVGAFAAAVIDGARSIANNDWALTPLGAALGRIAPAKLAALPAFATGISPKLWDPVLIDVLYVPTSLALAVVGVAFMAAGSSGRGRRR